MHRVLIDLSQEFIDYLNSDGCFLPKKYEVGREELEGGGGGGWQGERQRERQREGKRERIVCVLV